jgi:hypothetical protein
VIFYRRFVVHKKFLKLIPKRTEEENKRTRDKMKGGKERKRSREIKEKHCLTICCGSLLNSTFLVGSIMEH